MSYADIKQDIQEIKNEILILHQKIDQLIITCKRMDNHISNVETVYDSVRKPLSFIRNRVNNITGYDNDDEDLPRLEH